MDNPKHLKAPEKGIPAAGTLFLAPKAMRFSKAGKLPGTVSCMIRPQFSLILQVCLQFVRYCPIMLMLEEKTVH